MVFLKRVTIEELAWKNRTQPGTTPQQWAFARVNSMLTGGKADPDLQPQVVSKKERRNHLQRKRILVVYKNGSSLISKEAKYQMHHGEDWWWKMNEVHDKLLEKLDESCCEDCVELDEAKLSCS